MAKKKQIEPEIEDTNVDVPTSEIDTSAEEREVEQLQVERENFENAVEEKVEEPKEEPKEIPKVEDKPFIQSNDFVDEQPTTKAEYHIKSFNKVEEKPIPIKDVIGLSEEEKNNVLLSRIKQIMDKSKVGSIPALFVYRQFGSTTQPPVHAYIKADHICVNEAWEYYQYNAPEPYAYKFVEMLSSLNVNKELIVRIVQIKAI